MLRKLEVLSPQCKETSTTTSDAAASTVKDQKVKTGENLVSNGNANGYYQNENTVVSHGVSENDPSVAPTQGFPPNSRPSATWADLLKIGDKVCARHGGAAEHMQYWHSGVAHANASGANTKRHILGFLGMYLIF